MSQQLRFQLRLRIPGVLKSGPNPTDSRWGDGVAFFFLAILGILGVVGVSQVDVFGLSGGWFADRTQWRILCQHVTSGNFWLPMRKISLVKIQSQLYEDRILMDFWPWFIWSGFEWNLKGRTGRILRRLAEAGWTVVEGTTWLIATAWLLPNTWPRAQGSRTDSHRVAGCEIGEVHGCVVWMSYNSRFKFCVSFFRSGSFRRPYPPEYDMNTCHFAGSWGLKAPKEFPEWILGILAVGSSVNSWFWQWSQGWQLWDQASTKVGALDATVDYFWGWAKWCPKVLWGSVWWSMFSDVLCLKQNQ